jgi:quinoprotein dehydrogenase-associated probable ABC transporter substrate-binding protein
MLMIRLLSALLVISCASTAFARWELRVCQDPNQLPFSNRAGEGFDNRIAALLAEEMGADLVSVWVPLEALEYVRSDLLDTGRCDAVIGIEDTVEGFLTTVVYYRSAYTFVSREESGLDLSSLDDPRLAHLRIGLEKAGIAPHHVLLGIGLRQNLTIVGAGDYDDPSYLAAPVKAVEEGLVDVALVWGPVAGYFARASAVPLEVTPVTPEVYLPYLLMAHNMVIGVRPGDESLRDLFNEALARRWDDVQAILAEYGVPLSPVPPPVAPATDDAVYRVGLVVPMTTSSRTDLREVAGQAAALGARLAEEADSSGLQLDVLFASAPDAEAAVRAARRLVDAQGVRALIGGVGDDQARVLARVAEEEGLVFLNVGSADQSLRATPPSTTFHIEASEEMYLGATLDHYAALGVETWAVVHPDSPEGQRWLALAEKHIGGQGDLVTLDVVAVGADQVAFTAEISRLLERGAEGVLALLPQRQLEFFLTQLQTFGTDVVVAVLPDPLSQSREGLASLTAAGGRVGAHPRLALWETTLPMEEARQLVELFEGRWGRPMDPSAWAAYAAVEILRAAVEEVGDSTSAVVGRLLSPTFSIDVHKGRPLTFEADTHQLLQPLYVVETDADVRYDPTLAGLTAVARFVAVAP